MVFPWGAMAQPSTWGQIPLPDGQRDLTPSEVPAAQIKSPADQGEVNGAGERALGEESPFRDLLQGMGEIHNRHCACREL
ncbi:hypothetical protein CEE55_02975 [Stenotrophomonas pavanii]|uniref:Uncharacterized protein n=1 Tax=Stenotrophomonas pavanii TaxID=487698 RepID=A0A246L2S4_9GAMM|nr:hypothetical protein VO93_20620 [Stenotrophomonas maltophilia]OWR35171.1 hypothetical protein CEE55_02975 [Stenotrophomonas pavanii]